MKIGSGGSVEDVCESITLTQIFESPKKTLRNWSEPFCLAASRTPSLKTGLSSRDSRVLKVAPMRPLNPQILVSGHQAMKNLGSAAVKKL